MKLPLGPPSSPRGADGAPRQVIALGILMLARGQAAGLRHFGETRKTVLTALAPLAAFIMVALGLALVTNAGADALADLLSLAVGFLGQLVFSFEVARRWGRGAEWFHFATAFCWCQWVGPMAMAAFLIVMTIMMAAGIPSETAVVLGMLGLFCYGLWLHWFLARNALRLSALRAVALVLIVNAATSAAVLLPQLAAPSTTQAPVQAHVQARPLGLAQANGSAG